MDFYCQWSCLIENSSRQRREFPRGRDWRHESFAVRNAGRILAPIPSLKLTRHLIALLVIPVHGSERYAAWTKVMQARMVSDLCLSFSPSPMSGGRAISFRRKQEGENSFPVSIIFPSSAAYRRYDVCLLHSARQVHSSLDSFQKAGRCETSTNQGGAESKIAFFLFCSFLTQKQIDARWHASESQKKGFYSVRWVFCWVLTGLREQQRWWMLGGYPISLFMLCVVLLERRTRQPADWERSVMSFKHSSCRLNALRYFRLFTQNEAGQQEGCSWCVFKRVSASCAQFTGTRWWPADGWASSETCTPIFATCCSHKEKSCLHEMTGRG